MIGALKEKIRLWILVAGYVLHHNRKSKVVFYHDVGSNYTPMGTNADLILAHLKQFRLLGFEIVPQITSAENQLMICFDDGWKGLYDHKDIFIAEGIIPTVFIAVDLIGKNGYMDEVQIKELISLGWRFECHSWSHTGLHTHTGKDLEHELIDSKIELSKRFGLDFSSICFPQGRYNDEVIDVCNKAGYNLMFTSINGSYYERIEEKLIPRILLQHTPVNQIKYWIEGDSLIYKKRLTKQHYYK